MPRRKIIVNIATSADGFVARKDGTLTWLTDRPARAGDYGLAEFSRSVSAKILGRKTFDAAVAMGAHFRTKDVRYVFSRRPPSAPVPAGVDFVTEPIGSFVERMRSQDGKDLWLMGGGELIGAFLDAHAIDEFIVTIVPVFLGEGIPLIAPRDRAVPLRLISVRDFADGVVQVRYAVDR